MQAEWMGKAKNWLQSKVRRKTNQSSAAYSLYIVCWFNLGDELVWVCLCVHWCLANGLPYHIIPTRWILLLFLSWSSSSSFSSHHRYRYTHTLYAPKRSVYVYRINSFDANKKAKHHTHTHAPQPVSVQLEQLIHSFCLPDNAFKL